MASSTIYIIGIGDDGLEGLTGSERSRIEEAEAVVGPAELLDRIGPVEAEKVPFGQTLQETMARLRELDDRRTVILAAGDPLFYGTVRYLCDALGKERIEVLPHVSSMQMAFARVKEDWDEAYLTNLAKQTLERAIARIRSAERVGIFTTESLSPSVIARALLDRKIDYFSAYVCENLGSPDECVTRAELRELVGQEFAPLNVMILIRKPSWPDQPVAPATRRLFGNPDEFFLQSRPKRGLLTPAEVRSIALSELELRPDSVVWDVGAGSGSLAIEAAQIASQGQVYAIEMDAEDEALIRENAERFGVSNLHPVLGQAPAAWQALPRADAIFVGGSGRQVAQTVRMAAEQVPAGGRLVVHVSSLDNAADVRQALVATGGDVQVWMINLARGVDQLDRLTFEALTPTFLLRLRHED